MSPATAVTIRSLDAQIQRLTDLRRKAVARRQFLQARRFEQTIKDLQHRRALLLKSTHHVEPAYSKRRFSLRSLFDRGSDKPPPGVRDRYAGVAPTSKNAATLAAYYYARAKRKVISSRARAYFLLRLEQVKPFLPNKTGPGKLMDAAKQKRQAAARAHARKAYGVATGLIQQAETLEQQARSLELQEASGSKAAPVLMPEDDDTISPPGSDSEKTAAQSDDADATTTDTEEKPWYENPWYWAGGALGLVVLTKVAGGGKGGGKGSGSTSTVRKSYVVSSSGLRRSKSGGRSASTSLTRSL